MQMPRAAEMDAVLHAERLDHGRKRLHALPGPADELPDGSAIAAAGEAYILARGRAFRWTAQGMRALYKFLAPMRCAHPTFDAGSASRRLPAGAAPEYRYNAALNQ